jgi:hypothetical protein
LNIHVTTGMVLHLWHTAEKSIARHPELDRGPYSRGVEQQVEEAGAELANVTADDRALRAWGRRN